MQSLSSLEENFDQAEKYLAKAADIEADLVILPENFAFMGTDEKEKLKIAEDFGSGEIQNKIKKLAKKYKLWIIAGTLPLKAKNKVKASSLVFDSQGLCVARYDKIHLFDVRVSETEAYQESSLVEKGDQLIVVDTPIGKIGLTICYDLRFPELYRQLVIRGAELFSIPSAFTATTGIAHWEVLVRARAIENLCYVLAPNQSGEHPGGRLTYGHSMIVDPWGKILACKKSQAGLLTATIDKEKLIQLRTQFPCNTHHLL
jgi:nitrilase